MIKQIKNGTLFFLCLLFSVLAQAGSVNSATILKATITALPSCLHYQIPTRMCIWISEWGEINTTPIVSHYLPDLVISVFDKPKNNPWLEINKIVDKAGQPIQQKMITGLTGFDAGSGSHTFQDEHEQSVMFKEVDVIGNPALAIIPRGGLLPSTARPLRPYFQSMLDSVLWRGLPPAALPEQALAVGLNVTHHVGKGITNWGGMYPREGKVVGENDVKASAVIAMRAGSLVTSGVLNGHVVSRLSNSCGEECNAAPIQENSEETYFQMIYPITQTNCHVLGEGSSYKSEMLNQEGSYVWIVWRHYEGCADGDGEFLGKT